MTPIRLSGVTALPTPFQAAGTRLYVRDIDSTIDDMTIVVTPQGREPVSMRKGEGIRLERSCSDWSVTAPVLADVELLVGNTEFINRLDGRITIASRIEAALQDGDLYSGMFGSPAWSGVGGNYAWQNPENSGFSMVCTRLEAMWYGTGTTGSVQLFMNEGALPSYMNADPFTWGLKPMRATVPALGPSGMIEKYRNDAGATVAGDVLAYSQGPADQMINLVNALNPIEIQPGRWMQCICGPITGVNGMYGFATFRRKPL